jgi:pimeloyl-ACP methyl ester carboxylesterase
VLFCHGNAGNISHRLESIRRFYHLGLNTFIFDYRGYGQSEGRPSEKGTYHDVEAAWHYLISEEGVGEDDIIFFGRSLGGPIAAWCAQKHAPKMLILETTFTSVPDLAAEIYPYFPVRWLCRFRYDTASYLQNVHCPVFIIHSMNDEIVPLKHGHTLFEIAHEPKQLLEIKGSHNDVAIESRGRYESGLRAFISRFSLSHLD